MDAERWERFKEVVATILEREPRDWPACLAAQCGEDVELFLEVSSLLVSSRRVGSFIETPAWRVLGSFESPRPRERKE